METTVISIVDFILLVGVVASSAALVTMGYFKGWWKVG